MLGILQLPARQRRALAAQLREVQQNPSINQDSKAKIASGIIKALLTEARAKEELTTDMSSDIISTTASEEELRVSDSGTDPDEVQNLDEMPDLLREIDSGPGLEHDQMHDPRPGLEHDQMHDLNDINGFPHEISSATLDCDQQQNNTNHDFNSVTAPDDNKNYNNYRCSIVPGVNNDAGGCLLYTSDAADE